jgi:hypothetical protein
MPKNKKNIKVHDLKPSKDAKGGGAGAQGVGAQGVGAQGVGAQGTGAQGHSGQHRHHHRER